MAKDIPLVLMTAYADLLERVAQNDFADAFGDSDSFVAKTIGGRRYWYSQRQRDGVQRQSYVGPETPELLRRIAEQKSRADGERDRRKIVSALRRSTNLPAPVPEIGNVIAAMAGAGVFRLRGVLVGTAAYQVYSAMLGVRLPIAQQQTGDVDIAQFANVSVALDDRVTPPLLDALRKLDPTFEPVPHPNDPRRATTYASAKSGLRVDFLTPNTGPETDAPRRLKALGTDAHPLRFLDFLIFDPEPAVVLYGPGIFVQVPSPQRFAIHKLIVAGRREKGSGKADKDLAQATELIRVLCIKRPAELLDAWLEAFERGKSWQFELYKSLGRVDSGVRDTMLKTIDAPRRVIPGLQLSFSDSSASYDPSTNNIVFMAAAGGSPVRCSVSRPAIDDHFGGDGMDKAGRLKAFRQNRQAIETVAADKYLNGRIDAPGEVLITSKDIAAATTR